MLIVLNGYPGIGKLTIGRELAPLVNARLLDVHTEYNLAFALTEFRSDAFYQTIRDVWAISDPLVAALPPEKSLIMTEIFTEENFGDGAWGEENWNHIRKLSTSRGALTWVNLHCAPDENKRRIQSFERRVKRAPRTTDYVDRNHAGAPLYDGAAADFRFDLDVTDLPPEVAAEQIVRWIEETRLNT